MCLGLFAADTIAVAVKVCAVAKLDTPDGSGTCSLSRATIGKLAQYTRLGRIRVLQTLWRNRIFGLRAMALALFSLAVHVAALAVETPSVSGRRSC